MDFLYDAFAAIWDCIMKSGDKNDFIKGLEMYGSATNGLAIRGNSDLDMALSYKEEEKTDK